jgi:EF hand/EF-hand domain pair
VQLSCRYATVKTVVARWLRGLHQSKKEIAMNRKTGLPAIVFGVAAMFVCGPLASGASAAPVSVLKTVDTDNDGTVDLNEAKASASALFDRLDGDHDGTVDRKELRGRLSAKGLVAADPDSDGTLTKGEYLALVELRFKAADRDNDGTLDAKELKSLGRLLK